MSGVAGLQTRGQQRGTDGRIVCGPEVRGKESRENVSSRTCSAIQRAKHIVEHSGFLGGGKVWSNSTSWKSNDKR